MDLPGCNPDVLWNLGSRCQSVEIVPWTMVQLAMSSRNEGCAVCECDAFVTPSPPVPAPMNRQLLDLACLLRSDVTHAGGAGRSDC
jgi:hypothetical protein